MKLFVKPLSLLWKCHHFSCNYLSSYHGIQVICLHEMLINCDYIVAIKPYEQEGITERIKFSYQMATLTNLSKPAGGRTVVVLFLFERCSSVLSRILFLWTHICQVR